MQIAEGLATSDNERGILSEFRAAQPRAHARLTGLTICQASMKTTFLARNARRRVRVALRALSKFQSAARRAHDARFHLTSNQVLTHAARAAASQLNKLFSLPCTAPLVAARRAARAKGSGYSNARGVLLI